MLPWVYRWFLNYNTFGSRKKLFCAKFVLEHLYCIVCPQKIIFNFKVRVSTVAWNLLLSKSPTKVDIITHSKAVYVVSWMIYFGFIAHYLLRGDTKKKLKISSLVWLNENSYVEICDLMLDSFSFVVSCCIL